MNVIRSLWASIQGSPAFMRRVNGWLTILWIVMIPISLITGWISSVTYVAALSLWALVSGHWSAWGKPPGSRSGKRRRLAAVEQTPVVERVVDKLVDETTIDPLAGQPSPTQRLQQQQHSARDSAHAFAER